MERLVILLNVLLVLMLSTQITYATIDELMCAFKPVTVLHVEDAKHLDKDGNAVNEAYLADSSTYRMYLLEIKNGEGGIGLVAAFTGDIKIQWPRVKCPYRFTNGNMYYLSGGAKMESTMNALKCEQETDFSWVHVGTAITTDVVNLLNGYRALRCNSS